MIDVFIREKLAMAVREAQMAEENAVEIEALRSIQSGPGLRRRLGQAFIVIGRKLDPEVVNLDASPSAETA